MRIEPKIYETTKSTPEAVEANVVDAQVSGDEFHDVINRFFERIWNFLKWNFSGDSFEHYQYTTDVSSEKYYKYDHGEYGINSGNGINISFKDDIYMGYQSDPTGDPFAITGTVDYD